MTREDMNETNQQRDSQKIAEVVMDAVGFLAALGTFCAVSLILEWLTRP